MSDVTLPHFPTLDHLAELDILIVGGGISGLTAGVLMQRAGYRTAILEQDRLGNGETARTSAHLTEFPDVGYAQLVADIGADATRAVAQSKRAAMLQIEALAHEMSCDYQRVTGYLFSEREADGARLRDEWACAREAGLAAQLLQQAPLPFATAGAVAFSNQAQFHPLKYLHGLIRLYADAGGTISEQTHVRTIDEAPEICHVRTERTTLHCRHVVAVTDAPITGGTLLETKLRANRSYVIALRVKDARAAAGLFWDTDDPYHYIRTVVTGDGPIVIVGGEDHRVGTDGETEAFDRLEEYATTRFAGATVVRRWSGQIMEAIDGLPYIGRRADDSRVFVATGYAGNGLTFGTLAAQLVVDAIAGRENPYAALYAPERLLGAKQWAKYAAQNLPAAWTLVTDMLPLPVLASANDLKPGEGRVLRIAGDKVAAARDGEGVLHVVSPTCTHMGCEVAWNVVEQTWDCPCHGSRYDMDGAVLHGPATAPLEAVSATVGKSRA